MPRLPVDARDPTEFASFTFQEWRALDGKFNYWTERWRRSLDFLRGQHWETLKEYELESLPDWKRFPMANFTLALYTDYLTGFLKQDVRYSAVPASPDPQDIAAAELSEQVLKYQWDRQHMDSKRIDLAAWLMATGTAYLRVFWNTNTGDVLPLGIPTPEGGIIPIDPATFEPNPNIEQPEMVDAGEIGVEVVSPQFVRHGRAKSDGVMVGLLLSYEEAVSLYGREQAEELQYSTGHAGISSDLNHIEQPNYGTAEDERALVIEHYIPPSKDHPEGLWWTAAQGGQVLLTGPWPLPAGVMPIVSFRWIPVPGEKHIGMSPIYDLTFQNKMFDEISARILEWHNNVMPKTLLKSGGGIAPGEINDKPGQELVVNPGGEPQVMEYRQAPTTFFQSQQDIRQDLMLISGKQFERPDELPSGGSTQRFRQPPTQDPGDSSALAQITSKPSWGKTGEVILHYVANFYTEPRVIGIQGPDKSYQWQEFTGSDLEDLSATVKVDEIPLYPWNRQALRDTVVSLLSTQAGQMVFASPDGSPDMDKINSAMQATGLDVAVDTLSPDVLEARNEHMFFQNMQQGQQPPEPQPWQDHAVHWDEHTTVLKSLRFQSWPQEAQQAFLQHVDQTSQILDQQAQEEQQTMIETERALREVRETAEVEADIKMEVAQKAIETVFERLNLPTEVARKALENLTDQETQPQQGPPQDG